MHIIYGYKKIWSQILKIEEIIQKIPLSYIY